MFKKNSKPVANHTLQSIAANAQPVTTIAGAAAALGMAAYWITSAANVIKASKPQQEEKKPAEKKKQQ